MTVTKKVCQACGKELTDEQLHLNPGKGRERKYCSMACYNSTRNHKVTLICDYCGKEFENYLSDQPFGHNFCSWTCFAKKMDEEGGDLSVRRRSERRRRYKRRFLDKMGGICVLCGVKGSNWDWQVIVHHFIPTAGDEEENLCSVHRSCHRTIERIVKYDEDFYYTKFLPMLRERKRLFLNKEESRLS